MQVRETAQHTCRSNPLARAHQLAFELLLAGHVEARPPGVFNPGLDGSYTGVSLEDWTVRGPRRGDRHQAVAVSTSPGCRQSGVQSNKLTSIKAPGSANVNTVLGQDC